MALLVLGCVRQAVDHEVREGFYFRGKRLDDPHEANGLVKRGDLSGDRPR